MLYSTLRNVFHLLRFLRWVLCYESVADMYKNIGWDLSAQTSVLLHVQVPFFCFFFILVFMNLVKPTALAFLTLGGERECIFVCC